MSNIGNYFESLEHCVLDGVSFGLYSSNEIKKLSVLKLTTPLSFDSLGHPIPGGLYDRVLGPATELDKCSTCGNLMSLCPGHLGYIELPVPVIHPLFYKTVLMLLKLSCRSCSYILIHENFKRLLLNQLKLLDLGLIVEAYEAENTLCSALSLVSHSKDIIAADANFVRVQLENYVEKSIKESMLDKIGTYSENRNVEQLRNIFISNVLKQVPASKKCTKCKAPLIAIKKMGGQIVMSLNRVEIAPKHSEDRKAPAPRMKKIGESVLMPQKIRDNFRQLWDKEKEFLKGVFPVLTNTDLEYATDLFFLDIVTVTPPWTRPVQIRDNQIVEPPHSSTYKSIIQDCMILRSLATVVQSGNEEQLSKEAQEVISHIKGNDGLEKLHQVWQELQSNVDHLLDKDLNKNTSGMQALGIKQVLEKKEGLFRMHMMGKRVNYAARTVITPDPNIDVDEIGVPKAFALKLTYPVPVTPWNAEELRRMILNGPNVHPGACMVQNEDGSISKLKPDDIRQRSGVAKRLLTPSDKGSSNALKVVYRHLCNGDIMLLNRQPTLHRPSIMAHRARVLTTEKTFRLHYANCKSYNADFDGDEMNAHFPQNELSRSEGYNLASVGNHYLVPKDGTPLSGLIQDHVIAGVKLSVRGRFFTRPDYQHLVFQALTQKSGYIKLLPPAIWKPEPLWSGKQVISTVIINVTPAGKSHINLTSKAKISAKDWETAKPRSLRGGNYLKWLSEMSEAHVIIRGGELLCGVLDKTHYGATPYGLVHCMYELYGGSSSLTLLSCFSKLFGAFLQLEGFTLGVKDILVRKNPDIKRKKVISKIRESGHSIALEALGLEDADEETVKNLIETEYHTDPLKWQAHLDRFYKESLDNFTNEINKICIPDGLLTRFPNNNLQLMIKSGAKGSAVNAMQISCLLGQIELEGKRPPLMKSGKALPSFAAFDTTPRAGGFVEGRFMTGIKPQEFFFHCMAGREGLIDTAVKTSRSGYLQRCLVKHLEGVSVKYDLTVRDSDGSIVQFYYGEDGMDISKSKFMNNKFFPFLVENKKVIVNAKASSQLKNPSTMEQIREQQEKIREWSEKFQGKETVRISPFLSMNCGKKFSLSSEEKNIDRHTGRPVGLNRWIERLMQHDPDDRKRAMNMTRCPDPVNSKFRIDSVYGSISENLEDMIDSFIQKISEDRRISSRRIEEIKNMIYLKSMMSISPPGEPVGLLAAQSIGEPSTQMTLNTFHFAGRGEMNVTLGIPRLREILMVASRNIKTPSMEIPFLSNTPGLKKQSENLKKKFARVTMADVLEKIHVKEFFDTNPPRSTCYDIRMDFLPRSQYKKQFSVKPSNILRAVEKRYLGSLLSSLIKASSSKAISVFFDKKKRSVATGKKTDDDDNEDDIYEPVEELAPAPDINDNESSEDELDADEDPESARKHGRHEETEDYDDPEEDVQKELAEELKEDVDDYDKDDEEEGIEPDVSNAVDDPLEDETVNTVTEETASVRRNAVISKSTIVKNYVFDVKEELWCELSLNFPVSYKKIDLVSIIKDTAKKCIVQEVPGIKKAITYKDTANPENLMLKTDGINLLEIFSYDRILNLNKLYSNDIHAVASTYGIEAACKVIVKEISNVFKVYGIVVDSRHLLLVADYMTRDGIFRPMSRKGLEDNISSFQKMTFESSVNFLKMATVNGRMDLLQSPSSCLSLGIPVRMGTGMFDLLYQLPTEVC